MSLTQTYYIAASARAKLGKEACRADHDLRLLVGHANLLDSLMLELAEAEKKQEEWFNNTVRNASKHEEPRHIQWADKIEEEFDDDSDSDSDFYDDEGDFDMIAPRRIVQAPIQITTTEVDDESDEEDFYEDMEDDEEHALSRTSSRSHSLQSPPELVHDEESDDDTPPVSPPQPTLEFSEEEAMLTTSYYKTKSEQASYIPDSYFLPDQSNAPLIASC